MRPDLKIKTAREWTVEPCDVHGDILDPIHCQPNTRVQAVKDALIALREPGVYYVDISVVTRKGSEAEGEVERVYDYKVRHYADGRVFPLKTDRQGFSPIVVLDIECAS